jgi:HEAT repeat protein
MLALWGLLIAQDDWSKTIEKLGSTEIKIVEQARHDLIDAGDEAVKPLQAFLEKTSTGRAAEQARLVLKSIEIRKQLTERIYLSYPYVEENIAAAGRDATLNLLQKMIKDVDRNSLAAADYQAVVTLLLGYPILTDECKKAVLDAVNAHRLKDSADRIAPLLADPNVDLAELAAFTLVQVGSSKQGPEVAKLLSEPSPEVKARAVKVLGHLKYRDGAEAIAKLLDDASANVRARAVIALAVLGSRASSPAIVKKLDDPEDEVRQATASALVELGAKDQLAEIVKRLEPDRPLEVRNLTLKLLAHLGDPSAGPSIVKLLDDPDKGLKAGAIVALGRIRATDVAARIVEVLTKEDAFREEATAALATLLAEPVIPALVGLLRHETPELRRASHEILRRYKGDALARAFKAASEDVAKEIAIAVTTSRQVDSQAELRAIAAQNKDPKFALALLALTELGDASAKSAAIELASKEGPWQADALVALNAFANRALYTEGLSIGLRHWEIKATLEKALDEITGVTGLGIIGSDRIPKETREASVEIKGVYTTREVLAELSRKFSIGFIYEKSDVRAVPLEEALNRWKH